MHIGLLTDSYNSSCVLQRSKYPNYHCTCAYFLIAKEKKLKLCQVGNSMTVILTLLVNITVLFHTCYRVCLIIISDLGSKLNSDGCHMWGRRCWPFPEHRVSPRRGFTFTLAMCSQCQFCLSLDYSIWMLILVCLLGWIWLCGLDLLLLESIRTLLRITRLAPRKLYLVITCPNSHGKFAKSYIRSSWSRFEHCSDSLV